jgi:hypothetical protein
MASILENIARACPYEDPTLSTGTALEVAYTALVDQHMVPSKRIENIQHSDLLNRMMDSPPWDNLPLVRQLGQPEDAHAVLLLMAR